MAIDRSFGEQGARLSYGSYLDLPEILEQVPELWELRSHL